jgi:hypothetical protein
MNGWIGKELRIGSRSLFEGSFSAMTLTNWQNPQEPSEWPVARPKYLPSIVYRALQACVLMEIRLPWILRLETLRRKWDRRSQNKNVWWCSSSGLIISLTILRGAREITWWSRATGSVISVIGSTFFVSVLFLLAKCIQTSRTSRIAAVPHSRDRNVIVMLWCEGVA